MLPKMRNLLAAGLIASSMMAGLNGAPHSVRADAPPDYPIDNGHFYTQVVPQSGRTAGSGFSLTNEGGIPFWDAFQGLGGVAVLGYPCSRRFIWHGHVCQVTQKAVLQWDPRRKEVQLVNVMDYLSAAGMDGWLESEESVPRPAAEVSGSSIDWDGVVKSHYALLDNAPITRSFYFSSTNRQALLGLPRSRPQEFETRYSVRFQRGVLYVWKAGVDGVVEGLISVGSAGEMAIRAGLFDVEASTPEAPRPASQSSVNGRAVAAYDPSSRGDTRLRYGVATWYGAGFHGETMRNGETFDMHDPTITACNIYPLGSMLRVTNIYSGRSIVVRVTDTGAFTYPILVDLSWAAFCELGNPAQGVIEVTIERLQ